MVEIAILDCAGAEAVRRGILLHRLFERLPGVDPGLRHDTAIRWLAGSAGVADDALRSEIAGAACAIIGDPAYAELFGPTSLAEAPIAATLGDGRVIAGTVDRLQVELVLRNLLANSVDAVQARSGGRIEVSVEPGDSRCARIVVADNGPGVPPATRESVFEPLVSGKPTGMGLGLAVSRAIAEAHGGTLEARAGGEFHLTLPCLPPS